MSKASIIILVAAIFILATNTKHACAQPPTKPNFGRALCEPEFGTFPSNSAYSINLNTLLTTLQSSSSSSMFSSAATGLGVDTAFGQYYCRGDVGLDFCSACIREAAVSALSLCPQFNGAVVYYQECTLRYQNLLPMIGVDTLLPLLILKSLTNVTDPAGFFAVANSTMTEAMNAAVSSPSMFATREGTVSATKTVHTLVQCSPDLISTQCQNCLLSTAELILSCCGKWPDIVYVFLPSCQMMYNSLAPFYFPPNA